MVIAAFKWLGIQLTVICVMLGLFSLLVWIANGREEALSFIQTAVVGMKGPWVWTFGYGLAFFIMDRGRTLPAELKGVLVDNEIVAEVTARIDRSTRHRYAYPFTVPITLLGIFLTYVYGIPNRGLAYFLLYFCVLLIYYIGGFLLFHFVQVIFTFETLFNKMDSVEFKQIYSPLHLENFTSYLAITTIIGLISIYAGFRGTVTAGFVFQHEVWRIFLFTPIILFIPGTLFYDYYPRYVLRKIVQHKVFNLMARLGASDGSNANELVGKLKEAAAVNSQILPFVDYKTLPSYLIAIFFVISLAYNNDPAVKAFIQYITNSGAR
jgi:hypothetical protein